MLRDGGNALARYEYSRLESTSMDTKVATRMTIHCANRRPLSGRAVARAGYMLALVALLFITGCGSTQTQTPPLGIVDQALGGHAGGAQKITYPAPWSQKSTKLLDAFADKYMASMTLDQKLGQLFLANFVGTDYPPQDAGMIERNLAGGVIMYARSLRDQRSGGGDDQQGAITRATPALHVHRSGGRRCRPTLRHLWPTPLRAHDGALEVNRLRPAAGRARWQPDEGAGAEPQLRARRGRATGGRTRPGQPQLRDRSHRPSPPMPAPS